MLYWMLLKRMMFPDFLKSSFKDLSKVLEKAPLKDFMKGDTCPQLEVKSFQSKLYHEGKIKQIIKEHILALGLKDGSSEEKLIAQQKANRLSLSISLGGQDLYRRGFKKNLNTKAPLAEHLAAGLLEPLRGGGYSKVLVPFAGSGTLGFESLMALRSLAPVNLGRDYAAESFPASPEATLSFLKKKLKAEDLEFPMLTFVEKDLKQCLELQGNLESFSEALNTPLEARIHEDDVFICSLDLSAEDDVLLPLNPPYGLRLGHEEGSSRFFASLAQWIVDLSAKVNRLRGFCLTPDEKSYKVMRQIIGDAYRSTEHINQGGRHIRAVYFDFHN